jgi:hypothetical protein
VLRLLLMSARRQYAAVPNARFWEYVNGSYVKITLKPEQALTWKKFTRDEEGYSLETEGWRHDGAELTYGFRFVGTDCDGRITRSGVFQCGLNDLHVDPAPKEYGFSWFRGRLIHRPKFAKVSESQSDLYAELAGY